MGTLDGNGQTVKDKNNVAITTNLQDDPGFNHAYTYAGYCYDAETGLYFLNARYYAAGIGRFLTKDSFYGVSTDPLSLNRYAYTEGDTVILLTHLGMMLGGPILVIVNHMVLIIILSMKF